jgi:cell fate (sporulation/competence/biofilm development) regulator YlbF (YheA/YmcA/DUF963 family)
MNVYDKAYELAKAIKGSEEKKSLTNAKKKVDSDPKAKEMYEDLLDLQIKFQQKQLSGEKISDEELEKLQKKQEIALMHSDIQKLFEAERRLAVMYEEIQKIIYDAIDD